MRKRCENVSLRSLAAAWLAWGAGCVLETEESETSWTLTEESREIVQDEELAGRIFTALDAAAEAGTDPPISRFHVRTATVVEHEGEEHVVTGGNTEYAIPEAIHGETSLLNHVTTRFGPETTRRVPFIAFHSRQCGTSLGCGDCRDYEMATTDYENLLIVCGQASDGIVHVRRLSEGLVAEDSFPEAAPEDIPLDPSMLDRLVHEATEARKGGVTLFTSQRHTGAAGLSLEWNVYRSAGADDAAFHYRYPVGGLLQQAAAERDYLMKAVPVVGEAGEWPKLHYRDRQYGYEASSFNRQLGREPIRLILSDGQGRYRMTTFEDALPHAFSTAAFMPEAVESFLEEHGSR